MKNSIKVLIADDEAVQRKVLEVAVPWEENGFVICAQARTGLQALQLCRETQPDIALIDINMPGMSGLALIEQLHKEKSHIKIIIISGHDEFEYARTAITLDVDEYMLKPIDEDELLAAVCRLKNNIIEKKQQQDYISRMCKQAEQDRYRLRGEFLCSAAHGKIDQALLCQQAAEFEVPLQGPFIMVAIGMEQIDERMWNSSDLAVCRFGVMNILQETLEDLQPVWVFEDGLRTLGLIMLSQSSETEWLLGCKHAQAMVQKHLKIDLSVGVGSTAQTLQEIVQSYRHALYAQKHVAVMGDASVMTYNTLTCQCTTACLSSAQRTELKVSFMSGSEAQVHACIKSFLYEAAKANASLGSMQSMAFSVLCAFTEWLNEYCIESAFLAFSYDDLSQIFNNFKSWQEIAEWLIVLADRSMQQIQTKLQSSGYIERAKQYIQKNFASSTLRVEKIAKELFLNESYLSDVFTKKAGMSVVEYITFVRLTKAKELLDSGCINVAQIAEQVGYLDSNYFSKCFKKKYGISPRKYLQMQK